MKYLVMECHFSYAVVLDEQGRFLNVANRQYEVGQTVTDVIEMQAPPKTSSKKSMKWIYSFAAMAACLILVVTALLPLDQTPYASVYMAINPEVRIDVDRKDVVVGVEGVNADGKDLIQGYQYKKKNLKVVMDELVDLAIAQGYLHEGSKVTLTLDTEDNQWIIDHGDQLTTHLTDYLTEKFTVTIIITDKNAPAQSVDTDYDDTDYGPNNDGVTDYNDTDYGPNNDGVTDYNDTDYGSNNDGVTDYNDTDCGPDNDGVTDYDDHHEDDHHDGHSEYDHDDD